MAWNETDTGTYAGSGTTIRCEQGPLLTPSSGAITVTDSFHSINGGTLSTINGGKPNSLYIFKATSTVSLANLTNIRTSSYVIPTGGMLATWFDGSSFLAFDQQMPVVDVKAFGAVGDGVTDDTAAIQAAITAIGALGGGSVYFPVGIYLVSSQLKLGNITNSLSQNSITFTGAGMGLSILKSSISGATRLWYVLNPVANIIYTWRDLTFRGRNTGYIPGEGCFSLQSNTNSVIQLCEISGFNGEGITSNDGVGCKFIDNYIHDCFDEGVLTNGGAGSGNKVIGNRFSGIGNYAIDTNDIGTIILGNHVTGCGQSGTAAVTIEAASGQSPKHIQVTGNVIENNPCSAGINVSVNTAGAGLSIHNVTIVGNTISNNSNGGVGDGILLTTAAGAELSLIDVTITGNTIATQSRRGVNAYGVSGLVVAGNNFDVTDYAVLCDSSCNNVAIGKNRAKSANHSVTQYSVPPGCTDTQFVTFSPTFSAASGVFTSGNVITCRYKLDNDELTIDVLMAACGLTLATNWFGIQLPVTCTAHGVSSGVVESSNGGTKASAYWQIDDTSNVLKVYKDVAASVNWAQDLGNASVFSLSARMLVQ